MSEIGDSDEGVNVLRLKTLAEEKYASGDLKSAIKYAKRAHSQSPNLDGLSEMLTAFKILRTSNMPVTTSDGAACPPDYYKILQVERFSRISGIKKQYMKLALTLHPDKKPFLACEEAFKVVAEAFRVLSDKIRRKEYDLKLTIAMQSEAAAEEPAEAAAEMETFWTACSDCRLLHKFNRKYLGHNLMCPNCNKSFKAVEASKNTEKSVDSKGIDSEDEKNNETIGTRVSSRIKARKMTSVGEILLRAKRRSLTDVDEAEGGSLNRLDKSIDENEGVRSRSSVKARGKGKLHKDQEKSSRAKRSKPSEEETMTLAEMQMLVKKMNKNKSNSKENEIGKSKKRKDIQLCSGEKQSETEEVIETSNVKGKRARHKASHFHNFDTDREEKRFKKGQVWAVYSDDDGMPRHYVLIDEVLSVNPFEVRLCWLDFQNNGDKASVNCEKTGSHMSCGRYKMSEQSLVMSLKMFSHIVDCERAARETYRVYPKKGSVWAIYDENCLKAGGREDKQEYDIVVCLTSYTEIHGLSLAYLEKVDGFRTVFKRREIGAQAIRWLGKDEIRLMSHQIPARKLSGEEAGAGALIKDCCWELDPASVPHKMMLSIC